MSLLHKTELSKRLFELQLYEKTHNCKYKKTAIRFKIRETIGD